MKKVIKQCCTIGMCAALLAQVACQSKKAPYKSPYEPMSDSAILAKADSIARAEGRGDTTGKAAAEAAAVKHTPEERFVLDLATKYIQELEIIRLGAENEGDKRMQLLARKMLGNQKQVLHSLDSYVGRKGLQLSPDTLVDISYANAYNNHEWDSAWVSIIEADHNDMINRFETAKTQVTDPDLQSMINSELPVLHDQLNKVEALKPHLK